jgi:hypothetical protein
LRAVLPAHVCGDVFRLRPVGDSPAPLMRRPFSRHATSHSSLGCGPQATSSPNGR